jgi:hypothetical protein
MVWPRSGSDGLRAALRVTACGASTVTLQPPGYLSQHIRYERFTILSRRIHCDTGCNTFGLSSQESHPYGDGVRLSPMPVSPNAEPDCRDNVEFEQLRIELARRRDRGEAFDVAWPVAVDQVAPEILGAGWAVAERRRIRQALAATEAAWRCGYIVGQRRLRALAPRELERLRAA